MRVRPYGARQITLDEGQPGDPVSGEGLGGGVDRPVRLGQRGVGAGVGGDGVPAARHGLERDATTAVMFGCYTKAGVEQLRRDLPAAEIELLPRLERPANDEKPRQ